MLRDKLRVFVSRISPPLENKETCVKDRNNGLNQRVERNH